ncbi:MAG: pyridoxal-phosphate dependent enzyme, partial [Saccharopolyspora rectivirgula]
EPHPTGGWQEARRRRVAELQAMCPESYCPDQYFNPDNVAGYFSLAWELVAQLGRVDVLVCSVGTGGHSAGVSRALREFFPHLRLIGVDTIGSTIFGQPARPRIMRGLGSSIYPRNVDYSAFDEVHWVSPSEAVWMCRHLAKSHLSTGGWSVGAAAVVADWVARHESSDVRIATIFPDGPHRYAETIFDDNYCRDNCLLDGVAPHEPDTIDEPAVQEVRRWSRCRTVQDPLARTMSAPSGAVPQR